MPNPDSPIHVTQDPRQGSRQRQLAHLGDLSRCLHCAGLTERERVVLECLYRKRGQKEAFPTLEIIVEEASDFTKTHWSRNLVKKSRDSAYEKIEEQMKKRGML